MVIFECNRENNWLQFSLMHMCHVTGVIGPEVRMTMDATKSYAGAESWDITIRSRLDCARICTQHCCKTINWNPANKHCHLAMEWITDQPPVDGTISYLVN